MSTTFPGFNQRVPRYVRKQEARRATLSGGPEHDAPQMSFHVGFDDAYPGLAVAWREYSDNLVGDPALSWQRSVSYLRSLCSVASRKAAARINPGWRRTC